MPTPVHWMARGRAALASRCLSVAGRHTPSDVQVIFRRALTGCAWARSRRISVPRPVTRRALHVYLHEVAHVVLEHFHERPIHEQEFEAEQWAFDVMRNEGISIPAASLRRAQAYVSQVIAEEPCGTEISPAAADFASGYLQTALPRRSPVQLVALKNLTKIKTVAQRA